MLAWILFYTHRNRATDIQLIEEYEDDLKGGNNRAGEHKGQPSPGTFWNFDDGARGEEIAGTIQTPGILHVGLTRLSPSEEPQSSIDTRESSRTCGQPVDPDVPRGPAIRR